MVALVIVINLIQAANQLARRCQQISTKWNTHIAYTGYEFVLHLDKPIGFVVIRYNKWYCVLSCCRVMQF